MEDGSGKDRPEVELTLLASPQSTWPQDSHRRLEDTSYAACRSAQTSIDEPRSWGARTASWSTLKSTFTRTSTKEVDVSLLLQHRDPQKMAPSWRSGVILAACSTTVICLFNFCVIIYLAAKAVYADGTVAGIVTAFKGPCGEADRLSVGVHFLINILGSVLLAASNYTMQCLAAPTRKECDRAHAKQDYLDIGVNSIRNLFKIHRSRSMIWLALAFTSLPIHLLYNSTAFKVLSANAYKSLVVNEQYFNRSASIADAPKGAESILVWTPRTYSLYFGSSSEVCTMRNTTDWQPARDPGTPFGTCYSDCALGQPLPAMSARDSPWTLQNVSLSEISSQCGKSFSPIDDENPLRCPLFLPDGTTAWLNSTSNARDAWEPFRHCHFHDCNVAASGQSLGDLSLYNVAQKCHGGSDIQQWMPWAAVQRSDYDSSKWRRLELQECVATYGRDFVTSYNNVFFVSSKGDGYMEPSAFYFYNYSSVPMWSNIDSRRSPHDWLCEDRRPKGSIVYSSQTILCDLSQLQQDLSGYTLGGVAIDYCMAELASDTHCKLQFSIPLLTVVVVCNAIKAALMFLTVYRHREQTLVVLGDAISSYLIRPDLHTTGQSFLDRKGQRSLAKKWQARSREVTQLFQKGPNFAELPTDSKSLTEHRPVEYTTPMSAPKRMIAAVSWLQCLLTVILALICIFSVAGLLANAISTISANQGSAQSPWKLGFGSANAQLAINLANTDPTSADSFTAAMLLSNTPQIIVSFVYVMYNGLLSTMFEAREWSKYAQHKKALRVTDPIGEQRSTYFLSLPKKYGLPLLVASAVLHWLISSSLFLVRVDPYFDGEPSTDYNFSFTGYSPLPILLALLLGAAMILVGIMLSFWRFQSAIPVASSNSFAISAACHPPEDDQYAALLPIQWGESEESSSEPIGHCSFTSHEVRPPEIGRLYS